MYGDDQIRKGENNTGIPRVTSHSHSKFSKVNKNRKTAILYQPYIDSIMAESVPVVEKCQSSSGSSENSDILDLKDDEGWEDAEPDEEETQFISLLDDEVFMDIHQMLNHCKEKHNFDFLQLRRKLELDFYGNIKFVNYIRSQVHSGLQVTSDVKKADFEDDKYLKPILEDDAVLFNLDDLSDVAEDAQKGKGATSDSGELVTRVSELEEELRRIQLQFNNYRETVSETLEDRWNTKDSKSSKEDKEERDDDSHYFTSYSYNGEPPPVYSFHFHINWSRYP